MSRMGRPPAQARFGDRGLPGRSQWCTTLARTRPGGSVLLLLLFALAACEWSELVVLPSEQEGGVTRPGLLVAVVLDEEYAALAEALGWEDGVVPDAEVAVAPRGEELEWDEVVANAAGVVELPHLLPGRYSVTAFRRLSDEERALLTEAGIDARVLAGGGILRAPGQDEEPQPLEVQPDEPGSLVISEYLTTPAEVPPGSGNSYLQGYFIELYNNSNATIYLDGKILGDTDLLTNDHPNFPCSEWEFLRNDPHAISAMDLQAFPGDGRDHPLRPGEVVVVASEAIDHSQFGPNLLDLTSADFELDRPGGADNPHVPNMIHVGTRWHPWGLPFRSNRTLIFVADALDVGALPRVTDPIGLERVLIPDEAVLDLLAHRIRWIPSSPPCLQMAHRSMERLEAVLRAPGFGQGRSLQRKVTGVRPDGRPVLQRTRTSMEDLFYGPWTPGRLP